MCVRVISDRRESGRPPRPDNETVGPITGRKLVRDHESVDHMKLISRLSTACMPENNLNQADLPETSS